ncbi:MAG: hypothetical protein IT301_10775 [Dehalococcoidia bacterium]|nr:hypothetical protein [Dehalococcoidia bacterium]
MPPHCDSLDGPVVTPARVALDKGDVSIVLPFVPPEGEAEVIAAFNRSLPLHQAGDGAKEVGDLHFFETVVRVHRAGEGAPYTGLKPAGLDPGPIIPLAERAIETGSPEEFLNALTQVVREEVLRRFGDVMRLKAHEHGPVPEAREYVEAMLGLVVYSHKLYLAATAGPHDGVHEHG